MLTSLLNLFTSHKKRQKESPMLVLVGLGNPGDKYKKNRHNIGFMAIEKIAREASGAVFRDKFNGKYAEIRIGTKKIGLLMPTTYMNESGQSVGAVAKFYKLDPEQIIVFHDELDLEPGQLRCKKGGGHAGHNGLRSIHAHLGTADYKRVRLGIGHPGDKSKVHSYVLNDFSKAEEVWLDPLLENISRYIDYLIDGAESDFMSKIALQMPKTRLEEKQEKQEIKDKKDEKNGI